MAKGGFILIASVFFLARLIQLMDMPIFLDEATYLRMAQEILQNPSSPFVSLSHGHQPLHSWLLIISSLLFSDPLPGGRLLSVFSGFAVLMGVMALARWFSLQVGKWFALLGIVTSPLFLLHDRLAIKDSLLAALAIWFFYLSLRWLKNLSWKWMFLAAITLGLGLLTKSIALFFVLLAPLSLFFISWKGLDWKQFCYQTGLFAVVVLGMEGILRLSKGYGNIVPHTTSFLLSWPDFLQNPFQLMVANAPQFLSWFKIYLGWPAIFGFLAAPILLWRHDKRRLLVLLAWCFLPIVFEMVFAKSPFPRYFLFALPFGYLLIGMALDQVWKVSKIGVFVLAALLLWSPAHLSGRILLDLPHAPFAAIDRWQYLEGWPAGYGLKEAIEFFRRQKPPCAVLTEKNFLEWGLPIYLKEGPCSVWPRLAEQALVQPEIVLAKLSPSAIFLVFNYRQEIPHQAGLKEVFTYPRVGAKEFLRVYQWGRPGNEAGGPFENNKTKKAAPAEAKDD